ncbi:hypothetical protein ACKC9G_16435 [Pokkaliibacter sp. CJK22405]|uniref:hypothetical protein n=1 Tax=Pokkaliibacter sp. CJK22405 TaxID=3384615 RepID=UPI0039849980
MLRDLNTLSQLMSVDPCLSLGGVLDAEVCQCRDGTWKCHILLYAGTTQSPAHLDRWELRSRDGLLLAYHDIPHGNESEAIQDSLDGIEIPDNVDQVMLRAHNRQQGYVGMPMALPLHRLN